MMLNYDRVKCSVEEIKMRSGDICRQFPICKDCPFHDTMPIIIDGVKINEVDDCMFNKFVKNWNRFNEKEVDE